MKKDQKKAPIVEAIQVYHKSNILPFTTPRHCRNGIFYPTGIPALIPGERITEKIVEYLKKNKAAGMFALDPSDQELKTLRIVDLSNK